MASADVEPFPSRPSTVLALAPAGTSPATGGCLRSWPWPRGSRGGLAHGEPAWLPTAPHGSSGMSAGLPGASLLVSGDGSTGHPWAPRLQQEVGAAILKANWPPLQFFFCHNERPALWYRSASTRVVHWDFGSCWSPSPVARDHGSCWRLSLARLFTSTAQSSTRPSTSMATLVLARDYGTCWCPSLVQGSTSASLTSTRPYALMATLASPRDYGTCWSPSLVIAYVLLLLCWRRTFCCLVALRLARLAVAAISCRWPQRGQPSASASPQHHVACQRQPGKERSRSEGPARRGIMAFLVGVVAIAHSRAGCSRSVAAGRSTTGPWRELQRTSFASARRHVTRVSRTMT